MTSAEIWFGGLTALLTGFNLAILAILVSQTRRYARAAEDSVRALVRPYVKVSLAEAQDISDHNIRFLVRNIGVATAVDPHVTIRGENLETRVWEESSLGKPEIVLVSIRPGMSPPSHATAHVTCKDLFSKTAMEEDQEIDLSSL